MRRLLTGDQVVVVSGAHRGKTGKVKKFDPENDRVVIEGVNKRKRHIRPTPQRPGGILEEEAPIHASNVMPVDPETGKPTRVRVELREGKKVRIAKSGAALPVATKA
jgi:large subunit ribosomal protein L24